jgi:hypothetical protein
MGRLLIGQSVVQCYTEWEFIGFRNCLLKFRVGNSSLWIVGSNPWWASYAQDTDHLLVPQASDSSAVTAAVTSLWNLFIFKWQWILSGLNSYYCVQNWSKFSIVPSGHAGSNSSSWSRPDPPLLLIYSGRPEPTQGIFRSRKFSAVRKSLNRFIRSYCHFKLQI